MFESSFLLLLKAIIINILVPLLPGILFLRFFFGTKLQSWFLYILAWFFGIAVVSQWMFNLQFIHFGIGITEYFALLVLLALARGVKLKVAKADVYDYVQTLKLRLDGSLKESFAGLSVIEKRLTGIGLLFVGLFVINSFVQVSNFPSYGDDTFGNRHRPAINMYYDGGAKVLGKLDEILGRGRVGYPINIASHKTLAAQFMGGWYENYVNLFQWFCFLGILLFGFFATFQKTKNIFYSTIPLVLMCGLPLVFFHVIDGYVDLVVMTYAVIAIYRMSQYLDHKDNDAFLLGLLAIIFATSVKNEGLVVYGAGLVISMGIYLLVRSELKSFFMGLWNKKIIRGSLAILVFFFLPFMIIRFIYGLELDPTPGAEGAGTVIKLHSEVFNIYKPIFFGQDNYNVIVLIIGIILYQIILKFTNSKPKTQDRPSKSISLTIILLLVLFTIASLVFLYTENYQWALSQTTINRLFTMIFFTYLFFYGIELYELHNNTGSLTQSTTPKAGGQNKR